MKPLTDGSTKRVCEKRPAHGHDYLHAACKTLKTTECASLSS